MVHEFHLGEQASCVVASGRFPSKKRAGGAGQQIKAHAAAFMIKPWSGVTATITRLNEADPPCKGGREGEGTLLAGKNPRTRACDFCLRSLLQSMHASYPGCIILVFARIISAVCTSSGNHELLRHTQWSGVLPKFSSS